MSVQDVVSEKSADARTAGKRGDTSPARFAYEPRMELDITGEMVRLHESPAAHSTDRACHCVGEATMRPAGGARTSPRRVIQDFTISYWLPASRRFVPRLKTS